MLFVPTPVLSGTLVGNLFINGDLAHMFVAEPDGTFDNKYENIKGGHFNYKTGVLEIDTCLPVDAKIDIFVSYEILREDTMTVYRLERSPERRVFHIDIGNV